MSVVTLASAASRGSAEPPPAAPGTASLSGVVVDEGGAPIGGAQVAAYDEFSHFRRLAGGGSFEDARPLDASSRGITDAGGRFTLGGLVRAAYTVVATAPGHGVGFLGGFPAAESGAPVLVLPLGPGVVVEGDVVDGAGKGLAGAPVAIGVGFEREVSWTQSVFARAFGTTDGSGHFRVEGVPTRLPAQRNDDPIGSYSVCVEGPDGWSCNRFFLDGLPHGPVRIRFGGAASVTGKVSDASRVAVAGARVVADHALSSVLLRASGEPAGWVRYAAVSKSGPDGAFRVAGVPPGDLRSVQAYAGAQGVGSARGAQIGAGGETTLDVSLLPAARLAGTVTGPDANPIAGAEVFAYLDMGATWSARSDAAGRFTIPGLIRRSHTLAVATPGLRVPVSASEMAVARDASEVARDVRVVATASIAGRVIDEHGASIPGARVRVRPAEDGDRGSVGTTSGLEGAFLVLGLEPGAAIVSAEAGEQGVGSQARVTLAAGQRVHALQLRFPPSLPDPSSALDRGASPESVAPALRALVEVVRTETLDARRALAVERLRAVGPRGRDVVPALAALLSDPFPVGRDVANVLSAMGEAGALALATSLAGSATATYEVAAGALSSMDVVPPAARPALIARLRDGAPGVRASCAAALGRSTPPDAASIEALSAALGDAEDRVVRAALEAIVHLAPRDPGVATALRPVLTRSGLAGPALRAAKALGPAAAALVPELTAALRSEPRSRDGTGTVEALGSVGKAAIPALVALLRDADDAGDGPRRAAFTAMSLMRADSLDALLELAKDPQPKTRAASVEAIRGAWSQRDRVVAALVVALGDPDADVRRAVAERIGELGSLAGGAVPALRARLEQGDDDGDVTAAVIAALGALGPLAKPAAPELRKALSGETRRDAAAALGRIGDVAAIPGLTAVLGEDAGLEDRIAAAVALARKDPSSKEAREAVESLVREGAEEKVLERLTVAVALLRLDPTSKPGRAALLSHLGDSDGLARARAARDLADLGARGQDLVHRLDRMAGEDPDDDVRAACATALAAMGETAKAIERLTPLVRSARSVSETVEGVRGLGPAGVALVPDVLRQIADEGRFMDRADWIGAFGALGSAGEVAEVLLAAFLADRAPLHRDARETAAVTLVELGRRLDEALPIVLARLEELDYPSLPRALAALGRLGPKAAAATPSLERLTDHRDAVVREAAYAALRQVGGK